MEGDKENPIQLDEVVITPNMHISENGIELISHFEGLQLSAYPDPGTGSDPWTIGYGATFYENGLKVKKGDTISLEQAKDLLAMHLHKFENIVFKKVSRSLKQHEFDALVSFCFNAGTSYKTKGGTWRDYDIWNKVNKNTSSVEMSEYWQNLAVTGGGKKLNGLVRRRKSEVNLYLNDELKFY